MNTHDFTTCPDRICLACESGDHGSTMSALCEKIMACDCKCHQELSNNDYRYLTSNEILGTINEWRTANDTNL